jgi:hypothetical protein
MSQGAEIVVVVQGVAALLQAAAEAGAEILEERRLRTADGKTHDVDYVATDERTGAQVGVKVDARTERATFIPQDCEAGPGRALAGRIAQRYARSRITEEMRRKGYQLAKEEQQRDGTVKLVWQRWR